MPVSKQRPSKLLTDVILFCLGLFCVLTLGTNVSLASYECRDALNLRSAEEMVLKGKRTTHYYSGFGSSYGKDPLRQLEGYLDIGARLSPRGWDLFNKLRPLLAAEISDQKLAKTIVRALSPDLLKTGQAKDFLNIELSNDNATQEVLKEIELINQDIAIFKKNSQSTFKVFEAVSRYFDKNRNEGWFRQGLREIETFKKQKQFKDYAKFQKALIRERWNDSFDPTPKDIVQNWKTQLDELSQTMPLRGLSPKAKEILELQLEYDSARLFYDNYGGLYNRKDRSLVWYAAGEAFYARESFDSIQDFFAKEGITFEFKPSAQARILWDETISLDRKLEGPPSSQRLTFDIVSMSGNLIPEDLSRVYASNKDLLKRIQDLFENKLGKNALEKSGITFHLASEQKVLHIDDTNKLISAQAEDSAVKTKVTGTPSGPSTWFLTTQEVKQIRTHQRPFQYLLKLSDDQKGVSSLLKLMDLHREVINSHVHLDAKLFQGGYIRRPNKQDEFIQPGLEAKYFDGDSRISDHVYIEFRPEVNHELINHFLADGFDDTFDFRMISTIYLPNHDNYALVRNLYFQYFGVQSLYKWSQRLDFGFNIEQNTTRNWDEFVNNDNPRPPALNLDRSDEFDFDLSSFRRSVNLFNIKETEKVLAFLRSSQNFGLDPYLKLEDMMTENEFLIWNQLQDLVLKTAKQQKPLTKEIVDEFLKLAAQSSNNHAPVGYRYLEGTHEIWPGGKRMGDLWVFNLQEVQHFFREPYFELPDTIYRLSPTEIAVPRLSYRSPGDIEKQINMLIEKYHHVSQSRTPELAAILFYKDLVALHPLTDGNGRGCRAILSYLMLSQGIPPPSFERISIADLYVDSKDMLNFFEMGVWRGWQSVHFGGPPK